MRRSNLLSTVAVTMLAIGAVAPEAAWAKPQRQSGKADAAKHAKRQVRKRGATAAQAEAAAPAPISEATADSQDVVVTGTRIRRPNMTSTAPITTVDRDLLEQRGLGRIEETLSALPQVNPMAGDKGSADPRSGPSRIYLRKLGFGRTLTLLNGERMSNDVGIIPGALVERVDILTGGASAVYGSDAIAGVVNFIVKRRFDGMVFDGEVSAYQHTNDDPFMLGLLKDGGYPTPPKTIVGGEQYYATLAAGRNFADNKANISLFAGFRRTEPLRASKFANLACPVYQRNYDDDGRQLNDRFVCDQQVYNPYNYYGVGGSDYTLAKDGSRVFRPYDENDISNFPQRDYVQRSSYTHNVGGFVSYDFSPSLKFDANVLYTNYSEEGQNTVTMNLYTPEFQMPCDNPFMSAQQAQIVCGDDAGVAGKTGTFVAALFRPNYTNRYRIDVNDWRASAHLSGRLTNEISYDASFQKSRRVETYFGTDIYDDYYRVFPRAQNAMSVVNVGGVPTCLSKIDGSDPACVPMDVFSYGKIGQDVWNYLLRDGGSRVVNEQMVANASVSGTLGSLGLKSPLADSAVGFAVVAEHRWNGVSESGYGAYDWWSRYTNTDTVNELGGELQLPLVQHKRFVDDLTVSGAYRISDYRSLDKLVKTWKIDFTYQPFAGLGFRGSMNRAIRQGVLERLQQAAPYAAGFLDYCAPAAPGSKLTRYAYSQCAVDGMTQAQYDALGRQAPCDINGYCTVTFYPGGNPALKPEQADSKTIGLVMQPRFLRGFNASIDYYSITVKGAFDWVRTYIVADQCYNQKTAFYCSLISRDPQTGQITGINARYQNSGFLRNAGIDFTTSYYFKLPRSLFHTDIGALNLSFNGSIYTDISKQSAPGTATYSCLGYFGFICIEPFPKYRHYSSIGWQMPWKGSLDLIWRHTAGTRNSKTAPNAPLAATPSPANTDQYPLIPRLPDANYFDLAINYPITKKVSLRFNVQNLFDRSPPVVGYADAGTGAYLNTYPQYYDALGRTLRVGLQAKLW